MYSPELSMASKVLSGSTVEGNSLELMKSDGVVSCETLIGLGVDVGGVGAGRFFLGVLEGACNVMQQ